MHPHFGFTDRSDADCDMRLNFFQEKIKAVSAKLSNLEQKRFYTPTYDAEKVDECHKISDA